MADDSVESAVDKYLESEAALAAGYISAARRKLLIIILMAAAAVAIALFSLTVNNCGLNVIEVLDLIFAHLGGATYEIYTPEWFNDVYIWGNSLPRMLFTVLAAVGLAVAGASMQSMMNNPLADPYTVGVSSGACLGLAVAVVIGLSVSYGDTVAILMVSFLFSLLPLAAIVIFAPKTRASPSTLILAGVALSYLFNSFNTLILATVESETLSKIYIWQTGTLGSISWENLPIAFMFILAGSLVILYLARQLNLLSLGDASASSLGVDPDNLRIICLVAIAFIVGAIVGCAGVIGFVGLVTPHIVRMLLGSDNRYVIPASALLATIMMLLADVVCRTLSEYDNIPIGAILSLIGAPIFLYLIMRRHSYVWRRGRCLRL